MNREVKMGVYTKNGEENIFNFYTTLRAVDKLKFVNYVTNTLIGNDYNLVIRDLIFDYAIISIITDIDTSYIEKSSDAISMIEDLLDETNIVEIVKANAYELIEELNKAVDDNIAYRTGIHKNPIADSLSHLLNTIEKKVSGIDTEKMMEMAQVLSNISGELTVDKMLEAYSKSDIFKKNREQMIADKQHNNEIKATGEAIKTVVENAKKIRNNKKIVPMK